MKVACNVETPEEGARRLAQAIVKGPFSPEALHVYRDAGGEPVCWRWRVRKPDGEKVMRPMHWNGGAYVTGEPPAPVEGKPLYRLPELQAADPATLVLIVEGEKCVESLESLRLIATTSGSCSSASGANWQPLSGRHCLIWPDSDSPGGKYAADVAAKLSMLGCTVEIIEVKALGLPHKGDVVDWLALHPDAKAGDVLALSRVSVAKETSAVQALPRVILTRGSDVQPERLDWVWEGWLAAGKLHVLAGASGTGKTTAAAKLAGILTSGGYWPDGSRAAPGSVVFWSGEDDNADTLNPRFRAAGADMERIFTIDGLREGKGLVPFDPARDLAALQAVLVNIPDVRMIVIDPLVSAIAGDSHKNAEVRRGLQPLVDLAGQLRCALLGITHFSKGTSGRDPVERIIGSVAFGALPRLVIVTAKRDAEGDRPERRVMVRAMSNIGKEGDGYVYQLLQGELPGYPGITASSVCWGEPLCGSARELLAEVEQRDQDIEAGGAAVDFLHSLLARGSRAVNEIKAEAEAAGFAWRTLERAKRRAGVEARKSGMSGGWEWFKDVKTAKDRQPESVAAFGGLQQTASIAANGDDQEGA